MPIEPQAPVRFVLDTDCVVAAMRSPAGASAAIIRAVLAGSATALVSVPLALEYEAVACRPEHQRAAGLSPAEAELFVNALIGIAEPVQVWYLWRPQLVDGADEFVLEAAVNGRADAIVGFNRKHLAAAATRFGLRYLAPGEALRSLS